MILETLAGVAALACMCFFLRDFRIISIFASNTHPLANGPPSLPMIGNILNLPVKSAWVTFTQYQRRYGDLIYFHGLGYKLLVVNSMQAAIDLLDKRGEIYSHRPVFTMLGELMGLQESMPLLPYGRKWKACRKLSFLVLSPNAIKKNHSVQEKFAALLCRDLLDKPGDFMSLIRLTAGRIILSVTYGLSVGSADNTYITHAEATMRRVGRATVPGAYLCDLLPILKNLPSWVPFQREAAIGKDMVEKLVTMPFEHVKEMMENGTAESSMVHDLLSMGSDDSEKFEHEIKWTAGAMYGAGSDSIYSTILTLLMAMALHPDKQIRAREEIDQIVGMSRLPSLSDASALPYVNAVIKETMRWHPALPLGLARRNAKDDIYGGRLIPEGTIIVTNIWSIALAPNERYRPEEFMPERFLDDQENIPDPTTWAFGFGRRDCPGKYLAQNTLFILISCIIASFEISPHASETIIPEFYGDLLSFPKPFKCQFTPRPHAKEILLAWNTDTTTTRED